MRIVLPIALCGSFVETIMTRRSPLGEREGSSIGNGWACVREQRKARLAPGCELADALGDAGDEPGGELGGRLDGAAGIDRRGLVVGEGDDEGEDASGRIARGNGNGGG